MHSLETIKRLNNQSHENWLEKQGQEHHKSTAQAETQDQRFLVFAINQALRFASSNTEVSALLKVALGLAGKTEKV